MTFHKGFSRHWIRKREVCFLGGDRVIEIRVRPDIDKMASDKANEKQYRDRAANMLVG